MWVNIYPPHGRKTNQRTANILRGLLGNNITVWEHAYVFALDRVVDEKLDVNDTVLVSLLA